jgi:hypothetical protein
MIPTFVIAAVVLGVLCELPIGYIALAVVIAGAILAVV